jgi:hypothetical protein
VSLTRVPARPRAPLAGGAGGVFPSAFASGTYGTTVVSGGTAGTFGSWTELIAASAVAVQFRVAAAWVHHATQTSRVRLQLGVGGAGSEVPVSDVMLDVPHPPSYTDLYGVLPLIPANSRVAARTASIAGYLWEVRLLWVPA